MNPNETHSPGELNPAAEPASNPAAEQAPSPAAAGHSRRAFLFKLSLALNGAVGAVLAVPIVGYLLGPRFSKRSSAERVGRTWAASKIFLKGETRLADFRNPITTRWDGETGNIPCWVRHISGSSFQVFAINCAHLGCPVRWFAAIAVCSCAPATAALTTRMDRAPPALRNAGSSSTYTRFLKAT